MLYGHCLFCCPLRDFLYGCVLAQNRPTESTYQLNIVPKLAYRLLHLQNKVIAACMTYIKSFSQLLCEQSFQEAVNTRALYTKI
jgi:hypothetical protein